jgi:hypothetical protein
MITIEHLEVRFEAEPERDAAAFARLFAQHIAAHDAARDDARIAAARARTERSIGERRGAW